ncbi:MAG TPA: glycosyltransferase [Stellaceae bacterium]|nr:glycosyltransferase [Stellaceae bacterium]
MMPTTRIKERQEPATAERLAPLALLLLCDYDRTVPETARHHMDALAGLSRHRVHRLDLARRLPREIDLDRFDGVVIHYSLLASLDFLAEETTLERLAGFRGIKALFIQDEHRHVLRTRALLRRLGITVLFTCVPAAEVEKVYPMAELPGLRKESVLTGYVAQDLVRRTVPPLAGRPVDVGYRARRVPAWLGRLGQEKWQIGVRFAADAGDHGLICDISHREEDRLQGEGWVAFLTRCKAVLGSESGSSVFDWSGGIEQAVTRDALRAPDTSFETLRERYFRDEEDRVRNGQISPRCFEAAALRTLMILYEGGYSGVLTPWRHYVPLARNHANMAEVVAVLRDPARAQAIVDTAHREIACNDAYSFAAHVGRVDAVLAEEKRTTSAPGYPPSAWAKLARPSLAYRLHRLKREMWIIAYRSFFRGALGWLPLERRDRIHRGLRRWLRPSLPVR